MDLNELKKSIFSISSASEFNGLAIEIFRFQYSNNVVFQRFVDLNGTDARLVRHISQIPFLPVEFFKSHKIICGNIEPSQFFISSGTTGEKGSRHYIGDPDLYEKSFTSSFEMFYGNPKQYIIPALMPSNCERTNSSLIFMVERLIRNSGNPLSGFYLRNYDELAEMLVSSTETILLLGVTYALVDFAERFDIHLRNGIVMETGGMKGRGKEIVRGELHGILKARFGVTEIHSEYGMTEMLTQAYSRGGGIFRSPPWMKVLIRDLNDPRSVQDQGKTGGINIIDLANVHSCSFLATQDLGRIFDDGSFEILGRFDNSDIRGCNLLVD
jgi:hypothetical protein